MHCNSRHSALFALLLTFALAALATAGGKFAIDGLHGLPNALYFGVDIEAAYPGQDFTLLHAARVPMYEVLAEGVTSAWDDTIVVQVPSGTPALYFVIDVGSEPPQGTQLPIPLIICPDQRAVEGCYGISHVDNPEPGQYAAIYYWSMGGYPYRVGTGPQLWEVYPPEDYDAVIQLLGFTYLLFVGEPTPCSNPDFARLQQMLDSGGGLHFVYDGMGMIVEKPIIHLSGMARDVRLSLDVPGRPTYTFPAPKNPQPLTWDVSSPRGDGTLYYEAVFTHELNFVAWNAAEQTLTNRSWATARDACWIEFVPGKGYRIAPLGTLAPGEERSVVAEPSAPFFTAARRLDGMLREQSLAAGLTAEETESFFTHYSWTNRVLAEASKTEQPLCIYRLEGADYDALIPLTSDPAPAESRRVLWVYSMFPEDVAADAAVHDAAPAPDVSDIARAGTLHEYGFAREVYGGRGLDEYDAWGWQFYDDVLQDPTDNCEWPICVLLHTWGSSPLATRLSDGVTTVEELAGGGVTASAGASEYLLTGDEDTQSGTFPAGSYPPVVVARQEPAGGRLLGMADIEILGPTQDNRQFVQNIFDWFEENAAGEGPDFDIPVAVIEQTLDEGDSSLTTLRVFNVGDQPLELASLPPNAEWFSVTGPSSVNVPARDSVEFSLRWRTQGVQAGYHLTRWRFITNDSNEDTVDWPVRLHLLQGSGTGPGVPIATPSRFDLAPPSPNPFNSQLGLALIVPQAGDVTISVYNLLGQCVERVPVQVRSAGEHRLTLDFSAHSTGLYFISAQHRGSSVIRKVMLLK